MQSDSVDRIAPNDGPQALKPRLLTEWLFHNFIYF